MADNLGPTIVDQRASNYTPRDDKYLRVDCELSRKFKITALGMQIA